MANTAILAIKILADAKGAQQGFKQAETATTKFSSGMATAGKAIAAAGIGAAVIKATQGASDLAETMSKTETVFGTSSAEIKKWSETAAQSFGLSQREALDAASGFQVMFTQLGIGAGASQDMSQGMIQAAADLASFHNVAGGTAEVTDMLSSAMRGEYDSLQRLIPNINAAKVQQEAMAATGKKSAKDLTDAEKAAATYSLVLKGMGPAAGDWNKTAKGAANSQRTLTKAMQDTSDKLGTALLPALTSILQVASKFAKWASDNPTLLKVIIGALLGLAGAVYAVNTAFKVYVATMRVVAVVQAAAFLTNPIFLVIAAVVLLVAGIVLLWRRSETFRKIVTGAFDAVLGAVKATWNWVKKNWPLLLGILLGPVGIAVALIVKKFDKIKGAFAKVGSAIKTGAAATAGFFQRGWNSAYGAVAGYMKRHGADFALIGNQMKKDVSSVGNFFKTVWTTSIAVVKGLFNGFKAAVTAVFNAIKTTISTVANWFKTVWTTSIAVVRAVFSGLTAVVTAPFDAIVGAVQTAIAWVDDLIEKVKGLDLTPGFSLPDIGNPFSAAAPAPALSATARAAGPAARAAGGGNIHITVNGALDPEAVARQIDRIVNRHRRRVGTSTAI